MDYKMQWAAAVVGVMLVGGALAYAWTAWLVTGENELSGYVAIYQYDPIHPYTGGGCTADRTGPGEFVDLHRGTPIKITDSLGKVLALSELGPPSESLGTCYFAFRLGPLPDTDAYVVQVADRAPTTFTAADLDVRGWRVTFDFSNQAISDP
jgi:hypothetical protein